MKANVLLAKCENLLAAVNALVADPELGPTAQNRIDKIKEKVIIFVENINTVRKKVKPDKAPLPKPKCKVCILAKDLK